jgi:hypothetical protein
MKLTFGNDRVYGLTIIPADGDTLPSAFAHATQYREYCSSPTSRHYSLPPSHAGEWTAEAKRRLEGWHPMSGQ